MGDHLATPHSASYLATLSNPCMSLVALAFYTFDIIAHLGCLLPLHLLALRLHPRPLDPALTLTLEFNKVGRASCTLRPVTNPCHEHATTYPNNSTPTPVSHTYITMHGG